MLAYQAVPRHEIGAEEKALRLAAEQRPYGGAVAYFGFSGNLDSAITIRTAVLTHDRAYVQAGGGIVYDSDPSYEFEETLNKSAALRQAVSVAAGLLDTSR